MSITSSNLHKSSEAEDSTLPNHETDEVPSNKSQRNTNDPLAVVSDSPAPDDDSTNESSVCSTPFLPLKKLDGAELGSRPKTVKSILKSKSMFKAKTLKGITLNKPSSAPATGNKSSSTSKTNSTPAGKLENVNVEDDPLLLKPFIKSPNMYQEYQAKFWYSAKALENSKVSFSILTGGIYGEVELNTFRNAIGAHYLPHSSEYVAPPSIDVVRKWISTIGYGEEVSTKGTLRKSLLPPRRSQMHNNIMAAGSRDRPPMLAPGRYPQWRSRFLRYVNTRPNCEALRKCILSGPYKPTTILVQAFEATDDSPAVPEHTTVETPTNISPENKAHFLAEKEAIHLILTGIGDDI
nr:hypothetical protein [Tanacetum cinerariifolium]